MSSTYIPPTFRKNKFTCPHCSAIAKQRWGFPSRNVEGIGEGSNENFAISRCDNCNKYSIWANGKLTYPRALTSQEANTDLPDNIKKDFEEARLIANDSPKGAAALLRLCIQKICIHLGKEGKNLNRDIASLTEEGLPARVQQALDIVRVIGNNAVHPGQIDINDDPDTTNKLFTLVNLIADVMITQPKHVDEMFNTLIPESQREAIANRDGK